MTDYKKGDKAICSACSEAIEFVDPYWTHTDPGYNPRHIASPKEEKANCQHTDKFQVASSVKTIIDPNSSQISHLFIARVRCADCQREFKFVGLPIGIKPGEATTSDDLTELRAAIEPE